MGLNDHSKWHFFFFLRVSQLTFAKYLPIYKYQIAESFGGIDRALLSSFSTILFVLKLLPKNKRHICFTRCTSLLMVYVHVAVLSIVVFVSELLVPANFSLLYIYIYKCICR